MIIIIIVIIIITLNRLISSVLLGMSMANKALRKFFRLSHTLPHYLNRFNSVLE